MSKERVVIKEGPNFKRYSDGSIFLMNVRASFPNIAVPYEGENDEGQKTSNYGIKGLMPKKTHDAAKNELVKMINELLAKNKIEKMKPENKFCKDGDNDDRKEYEGHWVVSANEKTPPRLRDRRGNRIDPAWFGTARYPFFPGCIVNILINPWFMNNKYGKKVNANLVAVQFVMDDGIVFGEGRISDDEIDQTMQSLDDGDDNSGYDDGGSGPDSDDLDTSGL